MNMPCNIGETTRNSSVLSPSPTMIILPRCKHFICPAVNAFYTEEVIACAVCFSLLRSIDELSSVGSLLLAFKTGFHAHCSKWMVQKWRLAYANINPNVSRWRLKRKHLDTPARVDCLFHARAN